jgi:hypothetical protein
VVEYIEVTLSDIEAANRLAHEVLGHSLDELPPQTRKLLTEIANWVAIRMQTAQLTRSAVRFSRKDLREALGWGDTQLKVHLGRLAEMEWVLAHRQVGGALAYELLYDGTTLNVPHLCGLIDTAQLNDGERSGANDARSAPGRPAVGVVPAPGRSVPLAVARGIAPVNEETSDDASETRAHSANGSIASYALAVVGR